MIGIGCLIATFIRPVHIVNSVVLCAASLLCFGFGYASIRTTMVEAPVLTRQYYGPVYGRIIGLDRSASNAPRILLDHIYLPGIPEAQTPKKIRMSLQGHIPENTLVPGGRVAITGGLSPPGPPAEPGGFDFRRMAWFMALGGVGYTRNPVIPAAVPDDDDLRIKLFYLRMSISGFIRESIPDQNGAFASAIIAGDRSEINPATLDGLRASNLAHLLAISGLHMGLLTGFVFALLRYGLALFPYMSLRVKPKKLAAGFAIFIGFAYLLVSGSSVATQRAFIMATVVLIAVILDKPALTLRAVALAAFVVLMIKPYSVLEAGFQMSFAATTALIASYEWLNARDFWRATNQGLWKVFRPIFGLIFTSAVAGIATAPISAFHFNQISHYGLLANLLAVPIMGLVVMPSAVVAAILIPVGLEGAVFYVMGKGIGAILWVASYFSTLDHATSAVKSGPTWVLGGVCAGGLILILWRGWGRSLGIIVLAGSLITWFNVSRPELLIAENGRVFGVFSDQERTISKSRGSGYAVGIWLENDGDMATQPEAFERNGINDSGKVTFADLADGWRVVSYSGDSLPEANELCQINTILISSKLDIQPSACTVVDKSSLRKSGTVAISIENGLARITNSRDAARFRPWGH